MSRERPGNFTVFRTSRTFSSVSSAVADMALLVSRGFREERPRLLPEREDVRAHLCRQRGAFPGQPAGRLDRIARGENDRARRDPESPAREHAERPGKADREDGKTRTEREERRPLLEGKELPRGTPGFLGEHDDGTTPLEPLQGGLHGGAAPGFRFPVHGYEAGRRDGPPEGWNAENAPLGEKPHLQRQVREENEDVAEALVVRDDDEAPVSRELAVVLQAHADAGHREERPGPPPGKPEKPVSARGDERRKNRRDPEKGRREEDERPDDARSNGPHRPDCSVDAPPGRFAPQVPRAPSFTAPPRASRIDRNQCRPRINRPRRRSSTGTSGGSASWTG